jgi:hypothetical protein
LDPRGAWDDLTRWQVDNAVLTFGLIIENALVERINHGTDNQPRWEPRYTLAQLLDPSFKLPRPYVQKPQSGLGALLAMAQRKGSGVKLWEGRRVH